MANIGDFKAIDGYGNGLQMYGEEIEVDSSNNRSKIRYGLNLHVVSGGNVASSSISVGITDASANLGYKSYGPGDHSLIQTEKWVTHNADGTGTALLGWWFSAYIGSWNGDAALPMTPIQRAASIDTFTGSGIASPFKATFTTVTSADNYKLRISVPNVVMLQKFSNYTSGTEVTLSEEAITLAKQSTTGNTVQIGGVIESYSGTTKIGESSEIIINIKLNNKIRIAVNGQWKEATPYVAVNGQWKEATPYIGVNNQWKEGI